MRLDNKSNIAMALAALIVSGCSIKPKPLDNATLNHQVKSDKQIIQSMRPPLKSKYLSLNRAVARAIKYNFEARIKLLEQVLAKTDLDATSLTMLPSLAANAGFIDRSNVNAVLSPISGQVSTAEQQQRRIADLQLNWSLIDFGISYYMSKQKADEFLIAQEARRKMTHQLAKETRESFWKTYTIQKYNYLAPQFKSTLYSAISNSKQAQSEALMQPLEAAEYRRDAWDIAAKVQVQRADLSEARPKLMSLIHAPVKQKVRLITTRAEHQILPKRFSLNRDKLRTFALKNRPELRQEIYQKRITLNDVTQAKLKLLPNPSLGYGGYYDSNSFLVNNNWLIGTLNLAWDLMSIPSKLKNVEIAGKKAKIADLRRLGLAMAIVTQVDVAKIAFEHARDLNYYKSKMYQNDKAIYNILKNKESNEFASKMSVEKAYLNMVHSKLAYDKAYADYHTAAATLLESIGLDVVGGLSHLNWPVDKIIKEIEQRTKAIHLKINKEYT